MARLPRLVVPGLPHHVIQRGNNRQPIFLDDVDRRTWLDLLRRSASEQRVAVHAYVLMDNHVHLLVTPDAGDALSRMMQALGRSYVRWFNDRHGRTGTLWEGRFRATVIESERYFMTCMRYIESNPVRAGMTDRADAFQWSSHGHYAQGRRDPVVSDHPLYWSLGNTPFEREAAYKALFDDVVPAADLRAVTQATLRGWALGRPGFVAELATSTSRPVTPRPRGRPRLAKLPEAG